MMRKRILISDLESRKSGIIAAVDESEFELHFADLRDCDFEGFDAIIPLSIRDTRMLNERIGKGDRELAARAVVPKNHVIDLSDDKLRFNRYLRLNYPELVPKFRQSPLPRPFLLKKRQDCGGRNTFLIQTEAEQNQFSDLLESNDYFCQEYTAGQVEYTAHFLFEGMIHYGFTNKFSMNRDLFVRGERMKPFTNVQVTTMPLEFGEIFSDILREISFCGFGCFNYKLIDGLPQIFELNARLGGSANHDLNNLFHAVEQYTGRDHLSAMAGVKSGFVIE